MRALAVTAILLALLQTSFPLAQSPAPIGVVAAAGRRTLPVTLVNDEDYVALDDVAAFVALTVREDRQGGVTVTVRGKTIVAPRDRALVSVDGKVVSLSAPLRRVANRWLAPVDFLQRALGPLAEQRIEYRRASRLLILGAVRVPHVTTRVEPSGSGARVTLEIAPPVGVTTMADADRVVVRLDADALDFTPVSGTAAAVVQVRADQPATVTVVLATAAGEAKAVASTSDTSTRVVIEVSAANQAPDASSALQPVPGPPPPIAPKITTVVLDPGHGGNDAGVHGPGGTLEKHITLDAAKRLKGVLESRLGVHVVLTRDDDHLVSPDARTATANNAKGDVFVSLHMNASPTAAPTGTSVYFMRLDREAEDIRRQAGEQALTLPVVGGKSRIIETIRWDLAQARHIDDSERLARLLATAIEGHAGLVSRPVQTAPLRVLAGLNMPAVLFEMGYLTSPDEEKRFAGDDTRAALVQSVYDAISRFVSAAGAPAAQ